MRYDYLKLTLVNYLRSFSKFFDKMRSCKVIYLKKTRMRERIKL
jgi:hypothetical protein